MSATPAALRTVTSSIRSVERSLLKTACPSTMQPRGWLSDRTPPQSLRVTWLIWEIVLLRKTSPTQLGAGPVVSAAWNRMGAAAVPWARSVPGPRTPNSRLAPGSKTTVAPGSIVNVTPAPSPTKSRPRTTCGEPSRVHVSFDLIQPTWAVPPEPVESPQPIASSAAREGIAAAIFMCRADYAPRETATPCPGAPNVITRYGPRLGVRGGLTPHHIRHATRGFHTV